MEPGFPLQTSQFYLNMPLKQHEYSKVKLSGIPEEIIEEYKLHKRLCLMVMYSSELKHGGTAYLNLALTVMMSWIRD